MREVGSRQVIVAILVCAIVWVTALGLAFLEISESVTSILMGISFGAAITGIVLLFVILPAVGLLGAKDKIRGQR